MITTRDILLGVVLPTVVSGLVVVSGLLFARRAAKGAISLGIGLGFMVAYAALLGVPRMQPLDSIGWLFFAAGVTGALGAIDAWFGQETSARWFRSIVRAVVVLVIAVVLVWLLARPLLVFEWTGWRGPLHIGAIALCMIVVWTTTDALARRDGAFSLNLTFLLVCAIASATIAMSGTLKLGQIGGMLAAAMGAVAVLSLVLPSNSTAPGATLVFSVLYVGLVAAASELFLLYAGLTHLNAALLLAAPLGAWLGELIPSRNAVFRAAARVAGAVVPAGIAAMLAAIEFARVMHSEYANYGR